LLAAAVLAAAAAGAAAKSSPGDGRQQQHDTSAAWPIDAAAVPAYVITLKRTPKRFQYFMRSGAVAKALPHLQVVEATDGTTLTPATDDRFSVLARVNLMRGTRRSHTDLVTLGMAGLYVSHVEVWKKVVASGAELALVLEDDAEITPDTLPRMNDVLRQLPPPGEWDVWIVGCLTVDAHRPAPGLDPAIHEVQEYYGTQAYVISRRGAQRLLAQAYPMAVQIDAFMAQASLLGIIRTLWRADNHVHVKQLLFAGTTVQQTYCDLCDLPHDYNRFTDVGKWLAVGAAIGLAWYRMPRDWVSRVPFVGRWCAQRTKAVAAASKRRRAAAS
jgi:GR25 family glycosyltransferase involved in LPS biosynthesis